MPGRLLRDREGHTQEGGIPTVWKTARVVLIPKPGKDPMSPGAFRPISILPALSKAWEYAIKAIIKEEIGKDPFQHTRFGFRRGSGTVDATLEVARFAEECKLKKRTCTLVAIDVRNAFNTLRWGLILRELEKRDPSSAVLTVMAEYFEGRRIVVHTPLGQVEIRVSAGVPQGLVLGPFYGTSCMTRSSRRSIRTGA